MLVTVQRGRGVDYRRRPSHGHNIRRESPEMTWKDSSTCLGSVVNPPYLATDTVAARMAMLSFTSPILQG